MYSALRDVQPLFRIYVADKYKRKYVNGGNLEEARKYYFEITNYEMSEISKGMGKQDAHLT